MAQLYYEKYFNSDGHDWVVFIHGAGGSSRTFAKQVDCFREHFNVLLCDLRDHGQSRDLPIEGGLKNFSLSLIADDVISLLEELGIKQAHFIGVSMGSIFIRIIEEMRPDLFKSIILGGGIFRIDHKINNLIRTGIMLAKVMPFKSLYKMLAKIILPKKNHEKSREIFIREASKISKDSFKRWLTLVKDIKKIVDSYFDKPISVPVFVIMGSQDHVFIYPAIEYSSKYKNIEFQIIPHCGHVCNIERADIFNREVLQFLDKHFNVLSMGEESICGEPIQILV